MPEKCNYHLAGQQFNYINKLDTLERVVITIPSPKGKGGVTQFCKSVLPYMQNTACPLEIGSIRNSSGLLHPLADQFRFRRLVKQVGPALIHLNPSLSFKSFFRDGLFAWQAKQRGYPLLVFWHGWDKEFARRVEKKFLWFFHKSFGQADAFLVLASEFKDKLRDWGVTVPVHIGTTAVEEKLLTGFDMEEKLVAFQGAKIIKVLFLSRLERAKGVFETVKAVKILLDKKLPLKLTIAGDGKIRQELEDYTRFLGLGDNKVSFVGDIRGLEKIHAFTKHHVYCLPSYGEGLPTSVLEAMTFGMAVVTSPVGGLADLFEDGKMGYLVQPKNPEEIAGGLERLISNREDMITIAWNNSEYARKNFMASKVAERLLGIYNELKGGRLR